jgi:hypothetical protein
MYVPFGSCTLSSLEALLREQRGELNSRQTSDALQLNKRPLHPLSLHITTRWATAVHRGDMAFVNQTTSFWFATKTVSGDRSLYPNNDFLCGVNGKPSCLRSAPGRRRTRLEMCDDLGAKESSRGHSLTPELLVIVEKYLKELAKVQSTPAYLDGVLHTLANIQGETILLPGDRQGLHPFLIPLTRANSTGAVTGLLRWPTPPPSMEVPVVRSIPNDLGLELLAPSCKQFVTRALATADFGGKSDTASSIRRGCSLALAYQDGDVDKAGFGLERYLLVNVGPFPDIYEGLARFHLAKGDDKSGLVACERAATVFPGWGRAHVFHSQVLMELGREPEARDAARFGLQMPLWTLGNRSAVRALERIAGYVDESSLGKIYRRLFEDLRENEIAEGKAPQQVALDRAAYLLDLGVAEGSSSIWDDSVREKLAELYREAGLPDVATFVQY